MEHDLTTVAGFSAFADECHEAAKQWWTDLESGERIDRNIPELLALIHSEISECYEGYLSGLADEHIPAFSNFQVERADIMIRLGDFCAGVGCKPLFLGAYQGEDPVSGILQCHTATSNMLEAYRKGRDMRGAASALVTAVLSMGARPLNSVIEAKMAYNAIRADHKIENRRKDGGKKI